MQNIRMKKYVFWRSIQFQCVTFYYISVLLRQAEISPTHAPTTPVTFPLNLTECQCYKNQTVGPHYDSFLPRGICHPMQYTLVWYARVVCIKLYSMNKVGVWHKRMCYIAQKHGYSSLELTPVSDMRRKRELRAYLTCESYIPGINSHIEMMEWARFLTWSNFSNILSRVGGYTWRK
jgi:hypothetical protein